MMLYKSLALFTIISFSMISLPSAQSLEFEIFCEQVSEDNPIFVDTDKGNYEQGDTIKIYGCLDEKAYTKGINIRILDPQGNRIAGSTFVPDIDRTFSKEFIIDESFASDGTYSVEVDSAGLYTATKTFTVPEFESIALLILASLIIFVVVLTRKFKIMNDYRLISK